MTVFENFITELLLNGLIKNYTADKKTIRDFYNNNFKSKTTHCSFYLFCIDLWQNWYVNHFTKKFIYFDQRWINYLLQLEKADNSPKGKQFAERNVIDESSCRLCMVKFPNENMYMIHRESIKHKVRIQYLTDKSSFPQSQSLLLIAVDGANIVDNGNEFTKIKLEQKTNITTTLNIINQSVFDVEILEIIQINPYITDLTMVARFTSGTDLKLKGSIAVDLNGYFENSTSFIFPVVIVGKYEGQKVQYFLKEIAIEVNSEFSDLKSGITYSKLEFIKFGDSHDLVIPGKRPDMYASYYKEKFPLRKFEIPKPFQIKLKELITMYPSFIDRSIMGITTSFFLREYASFLKINPVMSQQNYFELLQTLTEIEENQIQVDVRSFNTMSKLKNIRQNIFELQVPGLAEARPSLLVNDSVYVKERKEDAIKYQGIVNKVLENSVFLGFNYRFSHIFVNNKTFYIEFGYNRRPLKVTKQALFIAKEHDIVSYFYPKQRPNNSIEELRPSKTMNFFNSQLNEEQKRAVENILETNSAPYLIFGPPGTGKTVTVVEAILQIWKNKPDAKILVCAPSNAATNEIALRLASKIPSTDIFRLLGNIYGQDRKILSKLQNIVNMKPDGIFYMPSMEDILKYRILLATLVTAARIVNGGVPDGHYSHVFIDESGYATESETLIPIAGILSNSTNRGKVVGQIVLAGDPRQLGPVVHSNFVKYCGYGTSMLERLIDTCDIYARNENNPIPYDPKYVTKLVKNYRSHKSILKTPNELFYHNELIPVSCNLSNMFTRWKYLKTPEFPVIFHHVVGEDQREKNSPSFFNIQEIEEVVQYVSMLMEDRVHGVQITQDDIGIITPYRKQAEKLRTACQKRGWNGIVVGSVEQFQGKEKLVIVISTVRSINTNKFEEIDKKCQLGFLKNPKRFNVALTRAKALLIVIGNGHTLKTDKNWLSFVEYCVSNESVAGKAFNLSDGEYLNEEIPPGNSCGKEEEAFVTNQKIN